MSTRTKIEEFFFLLSLHDGIDWNATPIDDSQYRLALRNARNPRKYDCPQRYTQMLDNLNILNVGSQT